MRELAAPILSIFVQLATESYAGDLLLKTGRFYFLFFMKPAPDNCVHAIPEHLFFVDSNLTTATSIQYLSRMRWISYAIIVFLIPHHMNSSHILTVFF